jgi:hypothetical protein
MAPKGSPAELADHCRLVLAHSSQQGIIVSLCFYAWAGLHYALAAIGMVKHMDDRAKAQAYPGKTRDRRKLSLLRSRVFAALRPG